MPMAAEVVTCLLERPPSPDHAPLYVARDRGFFREAGLEVAILLPSARDDGLRLAAAGKVDFALHDQPGVLLARAAGARVVSIGRLIDHLLDPAMVQAGSDVRSPAGAQPLVIIASEEAVRHRAAVCRRFVGAVARGITFTLASPGEAVEALFGANPALRGPGHRAAFEATLPFYARRQTQDPGRWADVVAATAARGLLPTATPDLGAYTNAFVPQEEGSP
jgi:ABC-type nitrate/sulfonate/bicarbonate transport system substrate-binding protein